MDLKERKKKKKNLGIKYYLNIKLKGTPTFTDKGIIQLYPLYVQLTYNSETVRFRSETQILHNEPDISTYTNDLLDQIKYEEEKIRICFDFYLGENYQGTTLSEKLASYLFDYTQEIDFFVDQQLSNLILLETEKIELFNKDNAIFSKSFSENLTGVTYLHGVYKSKSINIIELYSEFIPEYNSLKHSFPSKIWYFDAFYDNFKSKVKSKIPIFYNKMRSYTLYEYENGTFKEEFLNFYDNRSFAQGIIRDMDKLFT